MTSRKRAASGAADPDKAAKKSKGDSKDSTDDAMVDSEPADVNPLDDKARLKSRNALQLVGFSGADGAAAQ